MVRLSCGESSENHPGAAVIQPGPTPLPSNEEAHICAIRVEPRFLSDKESSLNSQ